MSINVCDILSQIGLSNKLVMLISLYRIPIITTKNQYNKENIKISVAGKLSSPRQLICTESGRNNLESEFETRLGILKRTRTVKESQKDICTVVWKVLRIKFTVCGTCERLIHRYAPV